MRFAIISLIIIFLVNLVGMHLNWYNFFWFDIVLHYSGGVFVALLFYYYLQAHFLPKYKLQNTLVLIGAVMFIGVVWEFAEYLANQLLSESASVTFGIRVDFMGDINDTITDLLMDVLGALTLASLIFKSHSTGR